MFSEEGALIFWKKNDFSKRLTLGEDLLHVQIQYELRKYYRTTGIEGSPSMKGGIEMDRNTLTSSSSFPFLS